MSEWISVKDRQPESNKEVLVCLLYGSGKQVIKISYWNPRVECFDDFLEDIITHWQPLPNPPIK